MRLRISLTLALTFFLLSTGSSLLAQTQTRMTKDDVEKLLKEVSNWGRWGKEDQLGAMNLITPEKRKEAASLVKEGVSVSLARTVEKEVAADNPSPFIHKMDSWGKGTDGQWSGDSYTVQYHGYAHTHMDSLCHLFHNDKLYNGFSRDVVTQDGALKLQIGNIKDGVFTRGVLIDIPRLRGVEYLEPGTAIYPEELEAWENRIGTKVKPGDVVFIRTGRWARRAKVGPWSAGEEGAAGLHASCARWLKSRDIAMIGSDAATDVLPSGIPGVSHPMHLIVLHAMGVHIFDNCDLEALGKKADELKRWDFLLTASPLAVEGGTGSPLNPIATF